MNWTSISTEIIIIDFPFLETPYVLAKFGYIFVGFVPERRCMICVTFLESRP